MGTRIDLSGNKFGQLTVISSSIKKGKHRLWKCICDCGRERDVFAHNLKSGISKSCGFSHEVTDEQREKKKAGKGTGKKIIDRSLRPRSDKTSISWRAMIQRCTSKNHCKYPRYGGRGITVCDRWKNFNNFLEDMGDRPQGKTLDRINNDEGYYKENCRWATPKEQRSNQSN